MAINGYYPYYQPIYQNNNTQIQSGGLVSVRSMEEAYNYPVAPGNSITFKDETQPFVYTKTKGFSPLEQPVFERYRLVKVEEPPKPPESVSEGFDAQKQVSLLWDEVNALKRKIGGSEHDKSADDKPVQTVHGKSDAVSKPNRGSGK